MPGFLDEERWLSRCSPHSGDQNKFEFQFSPPICTTEVPDAPGRCQGISSTHTIRCRSSLPSIQHPPIPVKPVCAFVCVCVRFSAEVSVVAFFTHPSLCRFCAVVAVPSRPRQQASRLSLLSKASPRNRTVMEKRRCPHVDLPFLPFSAASFSAGRRRRGKIRNAGGRE